MKVLVFSQYFYPENFNINDISFSLAKLGHKVTVITGIPNYPYGHAFGDFSILKPTRLNGVTIYRVPMITRRDGKSINLLLNYASFFIACFLFAFTFLIRYNPNAVISAGYSPPTTGIIGGWYAKLKRIPSILLVQDLWPYSLEATGHLKNRKILKYVDLMIKYVYRINNFLLLNSYSFKKIIMDQNIPEKKLIYFPDWPDPIYLQNETAGISNPYPNQFSTYFKIVFSGNIGQAQSVNTILNAAKLTAGHKVLWVLIGNGAMLDYVKQNIETRGIDNLLLTGYIPMQDTKKYFRYSDVGLVTLVDNDFINSTLPYKVYSYMASGLPVLASIKGDTKRVVTEARCGLVVPPEDSEALAQAALDLQCLPQQTLSSMGANGFEYANTHFNKITLLKKLENIMMRGLNVS